jgi:hypothetical protein
MTSITIFWSARYFSAPRALPPITSQAITISEIGAAVLVLLSRAFQTLIPVRRNLSGIYITEKTRFARIDRWLIIFSRSWLEVFICQLDVFEFRGL